MNSGHNPPILARGKDNVELLKEGSTVLGAFKELPFLNVGIIENVEEFLFCSFTDGLTEITNAKGEEFGDSEILKVVKENVDQDPNELNSFIINEMEKFKGENNFNDDITLFTCKVDAIKL